MIKLFLSITFASLLSSCGKAPCTDPRLEVNFSGIDSNDKKKVVVNRYAHSSNFSILIVSTEVNLWDTIFRQSGYPYKDTNGFRYDGGTISWQDNGSEMEIIVPSLQKSLRISDVNFHKDHQNTGPAGVHDNCSNGADYKLDGVTYSYGMKMGDEKSIFPIQINFKK
jgi:hypothetical protein